MLQKSPSGSLCPYYFKGAALQPLHYGSYHRDFARLAEVVEAEEAFILSSHSGRKVWVDLYETALTSSACELLVGHFLRIRHKIAKLALVGCPWPARLRLAKGLKQHPGICYAFFSDPEIAKDWLVGIHPAGRCR